MTLKIFVQLLNFCKYFFGLQSKYLAMYTLGTTIPKIHHCIQDTIFQISKFSLCEFCNAVERFRVFEYKKHSTTNKRQIKWALGKKQFLVTKVS